MQNLVSYPYDNITLEDLEREEAEFSNEQLQNAMDVCDRILFPYDLVNKFVNVKASTHRNAAVDWINQVRIFIIFFFFFFKSIISSLHLFIYFSKIINFFLFSF